MKLGLMLKINCESMDSQTSLTYDALIAIDLALVPLKGTFGIRLPRIIMIKKVIFLVNRSSRQLPHH